MLKNISNKTILVAAIALATISCKKENSSNNDIATSQEAVANAQAISVAVSANGDSIYVVGTCERRQNKDSIAFTSLPSTSSSYLTTNYSGYTAQKAFVIKDSAGAVKGYVAIIQFNAKPVGVKFDASGNFLRVLEQREGRDLNGRGWHQGGRFEDRNGSKKDTLALSALPAIVKSYLATNYSSDTLIRAFTNRDSSIIVLSTNNAIYATVFSSAGTFIKRAQLPSRSGRHNSIDISALPATAQSYLTATYPNYVFKHALKIVNNNTVQGYVVFLDANATKYAVEFDAAGNFVKAVTVR